MKREKQMRLPMVGPITYYLPSKDGIVLTSGLADDLKPILEAELRVMRGDFSKVIEFYDSVDPGGYSFLTVASMSVFGAIGLGDARFFDRIMADVAAFSARNSSPFANLGAEIVMTSVFLHLRVRRNCPQWMKDLDLEFVPKPWRRQICYLLVKMYQMQGHALTAEAMSGVLLNLCEDESRQSAGDIYLKLVRAVICRDEGHVEAAEKWFRQVVISARANGIILPFLGMAMGPTTPVECALRDLAPGLLPNIKAKTKPYFRNLVRLHNHYTGEQITDLLSPREFYMAQLLKKGRSYKDLAACMNLARGRVNVIVTDIYEKLGVHNRGELAGLIW